MSKQISLFIEEENFKDIDFLEKFKERKIKAKNIFYIKEISKKESFEFVSKYHYLKDAKYFSKYQFGLFLKETNDLLGVSTFSNPQGIVTLKSWFNLGNEDQSVLELSRLCMHPSLNGTNATSFLLGNSIKMLKKYEIRAIITLADNSRHVGSIYQVCNFKYFGLTDKKTDFYTEEGKKNPRGATKNVKGVWVDRNMKHRYAYIMCESLKVNYKEELKPKIENYENTSICKCCNGNGYVYDNRFGVKYKCPVENDISNGLEIL